MKLASQTFRAALDYLSGFGSEADVLLFSPLGSEVVISLNGRAYGEYRCVTDSPLRARFAAPLRIPARLVQTLPDDLLVSFSVGSHLKMSVDRNEFVSPLADLGCLPERPSVNDGVPFDWDASVLVPELKAAASSTLQGRGGSAMESVQIRVLPTRETIVASDGKQMTVYERKATEENDLQRDKDVDSRGLVHRNYVPHVIATCASMGRVAIQFSHSFASFECGRRKSIIPLQDGAFPAWEDPIRNLLSEYPVQGRAECDAAIFRNGIRQVKMDADNSEELAGAVCLNCPEKSRTLDIWAQSFDGVYSRSTVPLNRRARAIENAWFNAKYLERIASHWPRGVPMLIEWRGNLGPLTLSRPNYRAFVMPMLKTEVPKGQERVNEPAVATSV